MTLGSNNQLSLYNGRALDRLSRPHLRSYTSSPDSIWHQSRSIIPRPRSLAPIISPLQDPTLKCDRNLGWSIDWAVAHLVERLETTDAATALLRGIRVRAAALEAEGLLHQVPYRVFNRLDEVLFAGHLRNAVYLDVRSLGSDVSGATFTRGWGPEGGVKRIAIVLNADVLECAGAKEVLGVLVHQMIHAYFLVACGGVKEDDDVEYGRLAHGVHFGKVLLTIQNVWHGGEKALASSLGYGHDLSRTPYFLVHNHLSRSTDDEEENWFHSQCHASVPPVPISSITKHFAKSCLPLHSLPPPLRSATTTIYNPHTHTLDPESRARLPGKCFEFIFAETSVCVPKHHISAFPSIRLAFSKTGTRYCVMHELVSADTFLRFLEWVYGAGVYRPDLCASGMTLPVSSLSTATTMSPSITNTKARQPPIIKIIDIDGGADPHLLHDIQFAHLGELMGFQECTAYALTRMLSYTVTYEDPVSLLKEIYAHGEPSAQVKSWVRAFLRRYADGEKPNLIKLEAPDGFYAHRFEDAVKCCAALENEVRKVRGQLRGMGWCGDLWRLSACEMLGRDSSRGVRRRDLAGMMGLAAPGEQRVSAERGLDELQELEQGREERGEREELKRRLLERELVRERARRRGVERELELEVRRQRGNDLGREMLRERTRARETVDDLFGEDGIERDREEVVW